MTKRQTVRRPVLLSFRFLGPALVGSLTMALVSAFAPAAAQVAVLGALVSILGGLFISFLEQDDQRDRERTAAIERLAVPMTLASDPELFAHYLSVSHTLTSIAAQPDPVFRQVALLKLDAAGDQLAGLADGVAVFAGTETWRTAYERLLKSPDVREYRSVSRVQTPDYWQDAPGRQSMRVNYEAAHDGMLIERVVILADALWPAGHPLPAEPVRSWLREQHDHGIHVLLVREADLEGERDLLHDWGVYGDRAVGTHDTDQHSRTVRFTLAFDRQAVRLADDRWRRLQLYATPFAPAVERDEGTF